METIKKPKDFVQIANQIEKDFGLEFVEEITDNVSNRIFKFNCANDSEITHLLKYVPFGSFEPRCYRDILPQVKEEFTVLNLPKADHVYSTNEANGSYILLPYYGGNRFDFNTSDMLLAEDMVKIVKDLIKVNVEDLLQKDDVFLYQAKAEEVRFWERFTGALEMNLIKSSEETNIRKEADNLWRECEGRQKVIMSNCDFNPRNVIRLSTGRLVLIDWDGIQQPLEALLTYPWALNWSHPDWQEKYAKEFEKQLPVNRENIRLQLMNISLVRATDEKNHNNSHGDQMADKLMDYFRDSMQGFNSLVDIIDKNVT